MLKQEEDESAFKFSIFNYSKENYARYVKKCINHCKNEEEDKIDIQSLVSYLGFKVHFKEMEDKAYIDYNGRNNYAELFINKNLSRENKNAIAVLIIAEFFVRFRDGQKKRVSFDMFYLNNIKHIKMSKQIFLATRLALPEKVINKLDTFDSDKESYSKYSDLPVYFLDLAKNKSSVELYLKVTDCKFTSWIENL